MKNKNLTIGIYGFMSWLLPFVLAFLFFDKTGKMMIDYDLFKSIMALTGLSTGLYLLVRYFKKFPKAKKTLQEGLVVGLIWFAMNSILDLLILVKGFGMPLMAWVNGVGVRYLTIIVAGSCVGWLSQRK